MTDTTRRSLLATGFVIGAATLSTGIAKAVQVEGTADLPADDEINPRLTKVAKKNKKSSGCSSRCGGRSSRRCSKVTSR